MEDIAAILLFVIICIKWVLFAVCAIWCRTDVFLAVSVSEIKATSNLSFLYLQRGQKWKTTVLRGPLWTVWTEMCQILWLHLLASKRKGCRHEEESFASCVEATHVDLDLGNIQMLCCSLLLRPRVQSVPQTSNYKQSCLVPECGLAVIVQISVSAHILAFVVLRHLSSKVLLCGCCSVTCVSVPAGWLQYHTSDHEDVMEENTVSAARRLHQNPAVSSFHEQNRGTNWFLCFF